MLAEVFREHRNFIERRAELRADAERADMIGHDGLQMGNHRDGIFLLLHFGVGADEIERRGGVLQFNVWLRHAFAALGGALSGAPAEHQRLGDGIA